MLEGMCDGPAFHPKGVAILLVDFMLACEQGHKINARAAIAAKMSRLASEATELSLLAGKPDRFHVR